MSDHPTDTPPAASSAIAVDLFCPSCVYNLRGLTGSRCPECGESIDDLRDPVSRIPWVHRKQLGWWRAYWKTVHFVMFKQKHFANEMARPVSYRDAQLFRWVTVVLAYLPFPLFGFVGHIMRTGPRKYHPLFLNFSASDWQSAVCLASALLFLAMATGVPSYFFHPRALSIERQNRGIALTYYLCAPLAATVLPVALWQFASLISDRPAGSVGIWLERRSVDLMCLLFAGLFSVLIPTAWWFGVNHLARRALAQSEHRATVVAALVPVSCLALLALTIVGLPVVVLYLGLLGAAFVGGLL